jgi:hypothetical protein
MELEIMLKKISQLKMPTISCAFSYMEYRPKMMITTINTTVMIMEHECNQAESGGIVGKGRGRQRYCRKKKIEVCYMHMKMIV